VPFGIETAAVDHPVDRGRVEVEHLGQLGDTVALALHVPADC
jgi:hypothetical protein